MHFTGTAPTPAEVERIRLLLSTYQDGSGQRVEGQQCTLPTWRDFERSVALALKGYANESKAFFDVVVPVPGQTNFYFGISCKIRNKLGKALKENIIYVEVSNADKEFWDAVRRIGIYTTSEMTDRAAEAGQAILKLVESWHYQWGKYKIDLSLSYYLVLQYDPRSLKYQLFQLPLSIPHAGEFEWSVRLSKRNGASRTLVGLRDGRVVIEWYADAGGQLKYFPRVKDAVWSSPVFALEPLPQNDDGYGVLQKARAYFPEQWQAVRY